MQASVKHTHITSTLTMRPRNFFRLQTDPISSPPSPSPSPSPTTHHSPKEKDPSPEMPRTRLTLNTILLILSFLLILFLLFRQPHAPPIHSSRAAASSPTTRRHILFTVASSAGSWPRRRPYVKLWYDPSSTRAVAFLDRPVPADPSLPPAVVSADTSRFPYTFPRGLRSAVRVARAVKEAVDATPRGDGVRWFVFGDDDTVFFVDNLAATLSKYDHDRWFYVGSGSESYEQNAKHSFDMAFGGGGFAISHSLARVLARVLDSCLVRYAHLYGSDARIYSCLAELGVGLTHEPGFHQVDMRGDLFGMLSAHPLSPLVSLHHLDAVDPIFPDMNKTDALQLFFKAVNADPARIAQQTVCYHSSGSMTVSVAWGYAVQVFEGTVLLPDLLSLQRTFMPWKRGAKVEGHFMFNTREYPRDPCKRPAVFYLQSVVSDENGVWSEYARTTVRNCLKSDIVEKLKNIRVFSPKLELSTEQMKALRRQCCDILPSSNESLVMNIQQCGVDELISPNF